VGCTLVLFFAGVLGQVGEAAAFACTALPGLAAAVGASLLEALPEQPQLRLWVTVVAVV
jgi:hypothetical protein